MKKCAGQYQGGGAVMGIYLDIYKYIFQQLHLNFYK